MFRAIYFKHLKALIISFGILAVFAAVCVFAAHAGTPKTIGVRGQSVSLTAEDEADVKAFLCACGYEETEFCFERGITVPKHWNDVYTSYNELQRRQGFDLTPYKGREATEYVYFVSGGRNITVLTSGGRIIAVHICSCDGSECAVLTEE